MVQLGVRVSQFYEHESCGKCTPCRVGTRWLTQILKKIESGRGDACGPRPAPRRRRARQRHVPLPARRLRRDRGCRATCEVPRRIPRAARRRLPFEAPRRSTGSSPDVAQPATRRRAGARMSATLVKVTIDDREVEVAKGTGLVETAAAAGIEIPVFCYEPRLGPPVGACRMCLVEVEGLPKLQAGCTLSAQDGMVVQTAATSANAAEGQKGRSSSSSSTTRSIAPSATRAASARCRTSPSGTAPARPDDVPEADVRQADPGVAADRARPGALHPLLSLHAVLERRRGGRPADRAEPRRVHRDRDVRRGPVPRAVLRERDRALPGRRADLDAVPVPGAAVGDPGRPDRLRAVPGRLQHPRDHAGGQGQARSSRATTRRSTAGGSATRAASPTRT